MIPGMNKKQMKQMERQMKKMGMKMEDLEGVKEVIIRFEDKELIIDNPSVSLMNVMGQETYQVDGKAREVELEYDSEMGDFVSCMDNRYVITNRILHSTEDNASFKYCFIYDAKLNKLFISFPMSKFKKFQLFAFLVSTTKYLSVSSTITPSFFKSVIALFIISCLEDESFK